MIGASPEPAMLETASETYTIREYQAADEAAVLSLLIRSLGGGGSFDRTAEFWRWKHFQNAFGASQLLVAANEEMLGLRAFLRWSFRTPQGRLRAVRAVDTATHPEYRRLGVFSRLTKAALARAHSDGVHMVFNTPNAQSMSGYMRLGWQWVGRPRLLVRILNPVRCALGLVARSRRFGSSDDTAGIVGPSLRPVDSLFDHREHLERILNLDDRLCAKGIRTERSPAFIRWRYVLPPSPRYFVHWSGEKPVTGILIFRPNIRRGLREIMLSEFLIGYGAALEMRVLIQELVRRVQADYLVASASPGTQHWGMLRRAGFLPLPPSAGPNFTVRPLDLPPGALDPVRLAHWRLSLGDLELF